MNMEVRIATRQSLLALSQTHSIEKILKDHFPDIQTVLTAVETKGDLNLSQALSQIGDKGLFTYELECLMREGKVDIAIHSLKDLPTALPPSLIVGSIGEREDPRDALILHAKHHSLMNTPDILSSLPHGCVIGTSSLRRIAQLKRRYPHLTYKNIRGNIQTRVRKMDEGEYDAIILAAAGLKRGALAHRISEFIDTNVSVPAVGQGAIAIECREGDDRIVSLLNASVTHIPTTICCLTERAFLRRLEGGCQAPIAAHASLSPPLSPPPSLSSPPLSLPLTLSFIGRVLSLDGTEMIEVKRDVILGEREGEKESEGGKEREGESEYWRGIMREGERVGREAAEEAIERGAAALIATARLVNERE